MGQLKSPVLPLREHYRTEKQLLDAKCQITGFCRIKLENDYMPLCLSLGNGLSSGLVT